MGVKIVVDLPKSEYEYLAKLALKGDEQIGHYERVLIGGKPLPQGHWLTHKEYCDKNNLLPSGLGSYFWCSNCDCGIDSKNFSRVNYNYCPKCGADMREVKE